MEISIQKGITVSLHEQLVTQISLQIAAGLLKPGAKLPSIRALSQKLGIHHNTCLNAYRELEQNGLIHIRHGSGVRVATTDQDERTRGGPASGLSTMDLGTMELDQVAAFFVQQVTRGGHPWEDVLAALERARRHQRSQVHQPLVVVDVHADILPVFQAELQHALQRPVEKVLLSQLDRESARYGRFVVSRYHYQTLKAQLRTHLGPEFTEQRIAERVRVIDVGAVRQELDLIRQLPDDALVTVVSVSTIILQQAEAVIKALRGDTLTIRTLLPAQETHAELQRVLKRSQMVFADWLCVPHLQVLTRKPIHLVRTIPEHELDKLNSFQE
jgi:DNA-binding transcriptional regulator YhcF (GntR family)